jgi:hypothetical protein
MLGVEQSVAYQSTEVCGGNGTNEDGDGGTACGNKS